MAPPAIPATETIAAQIAGCRVNSNGLQPGTTRKLQTIWGTKTMAMPAYCTGAIWTSSDIEDSTTVEQNVQSGINIESREDANNQSLATLSASTPSPLKLTVSWLLPDRPRSSRRAVIVEILGNS